MREVLTEIRERVPEPEERADLYTALMVMAALDPWEHNLGKEISAMVQADDYEILKLSTTLRDAIEDGERKGERKGELNMLRELFANHAGREPTPDEQEALAQRAREMGAKQALQIVLQLHGEALATWLLAPAPAR